MVEFALVLPILMMFVFGIVEFGRGYNARIELTAAVREGVRVAALWSGACPTPPVTQTLAECVTAAVRDGAPGLTRSNITAAIAPTPGPCPANSGAEANVKVEATYPFRYEIPLAGNRNTTLRATGVMRCRG